jgi:hypothetical protein
MQINVLWDVTPYGLVDGTNILENPAVSILGDEAYTKHGKKNGPDIGTGRTGTRALSEPIGERGPVSRIMAL